VPADPQLVQLLVEACKQHGGADGVVEGLDATADSFYSSQGRTGGHFEDVNEAVIEQLMSQHPQLVSLEMETFHLLDLARCSKGSIKAAAFCIAAAERYSNRWVFAAS
jgi:uridine phosphorylase